KKSAQIREILISESAWEEMTCLFAPSLGFGLLGNAVGAVWGTIMGAIGGAVGYAALGWEASVNESMQAMLGIIDGSFVPWSH
ncbi:hypothetical protein KTC72_12920, partial [Klebsiella pneumoniae]|nr:hypothetical protein [Klebsiella pneumoniae]